jgi:hypothetical protein
MKYGRGALSSSLPAPSGPSRVALSTALPSLSFARSMALLAAVSSVLCGSDCTLGPRRDFAGISAAADRKLRHLKANEVRDTLLFHSELPVLVGQVVSAELHGQMIRLVMRPDYAWMKAPHWICPNDPTLLDAIPAPAAKEPPDVKATAARYAIFNCMWGSESEFVVSLAIDGFGDRERDFVSGLSHQRLIVWGLPETWSSDPQNAPVREARMFIPLNDMEQTRVVLQLRGIMTASVMGIDADGIQDLQMEYPFALLGSADLPSFSKAVERATRTVLRGVGWPEAAPFISPIAEWILRAMAVGWFYEHILHKDALLVPMRRVPSSGAPLSH